MVLNNNDGENNGIFSNARAFIGRKEVKYFVGGMIAAVAIKKIAETEIVREAAVNLTAETLNIKDSIEEQIENIREEAEDIHEDAKKKQQIEVYGPEDLDEEVVDLEDEVEIVDE